MNDEYFTITDWTDFVRGLTTPAQTRAMEARLAAGDAEAQRTVAALGRIAAVGRADEEEAVPAYAVRIAKAFGVVRRATTPQTEHRRLPFSILFDSLTAPAAAGTRGLAASERQLTVVAGDYLVDLEVEPPNPGRRAALAGQVVHRHDASRPAMDVPVLACRGEQILGSAQTNRFGEFQLADMAAEVERLCLRVEAEALIEIPLGSPDTGPAAAEEES